MHPSSRFKRRFFWLAVVTALTLVPTAAQANPSFYKTPLFGLAQVPHGSLLVADAGQGIVNADTGTLVVALPGVTDIAPRGGGKLWAITSGGGGPGAFLYSIQGGVATQVADLYAFEAANNPHPTTVESNPFDVLDLGGGKALVADAAGNDLLRVDKHGNIELVAVFPDELVSTANIKHLAGCPSSHADFCNLPPMLPAQAVPASVAIGHDGAYYVGELKGFPAPTGSSNVWRVDPHASGARCGSSPQCSVVLTGRTSILDVVFKGGKLLVAQFDDASWAAIEIFEGEGALGGSVHACNLSTKACKEVVDEVPMLTAITLRDGHLWGTIWALVPGRADAVPLT